MNLSIYVPKHMKNFIAICQAYSKEYFPGKHFSAFVLKCMRHYVNTLPKEEKKNFEDCALKLAEKESPKALDYASRFMNQNK